MQQGMEPPLTPAVCHARLLPPAPRQGQAAREKTAGCRLRIRELAGKTRSVLSANSLLVRIIGTHEGLGRDEWGQKGAQRFRKTHKVTPMIQEMTCCYNDSDEKAHFGTRSLAKPQKNSGSDGPRHSQNINGVKIHDIFHSRDTT